MRCVHPTQSTPTSNAIARKILAFAPIRNVLLVWALVMLIFKAQGSTQTKFYIEKVFLLLINKIRCFRITFGRCNVSNPYLICKMAPDEHFFNREKEKYLLEENLNGVVN